MQIIRNIFDLNKAIKNFNNFGFVPTMGGIHAGHASLIKKAQKKCKKTIVSIFVNPTQFNDKKDFFKYPRNIRKDIKILKTLNVDYLFMPTSREIYKTKYKPINIKKTDKILCAKYRKGHFEGVLSVMSRLLCIIKAKYVFMGEKDFQQLYLIKKYLSKKYKVKIINCKTIRDKNYIALSTRNKLLSSKSYFETIKIVKELKNLKKKLSLKRYFSKINLVQKTSELENLYKIHIDYLEARNKKNLKVSKSNKEMRLFVAFWINNVRLIDNY